MLNRRYLRIKVLQALYSFLQDNQHNINAKERELKTSIERIYDLYIYLLLLLRELRLAAVKINEERKKKLLPGPDDLNPNMRFESDPVLVKIDNSPNLAEQKNKRTIYWSSEEDHIIKNILSHITVSLEYKTYITEPEVSFEKSKEFIFHFYKKFISENEQLKHHLSEKNMHWTEDCHLAHICVQKTIKNMKENEDIELMPLYKADDDNEFMLTLFHHTILDDEKLSELIRVKISNWEPDRIALIDMLLMKMAITEILNFPAIPVKVSLNEYIEISKMFSSPKSNTFINGILDAIIKELRSQNKLNKIGRGLIE